jgi:hypothetical protein
MNMTGEYTETLLAKPMQKEPCISKKGLLEGEYRPVAGMEKAGMTGVCLTEVGLKIWEISRQFDPSAKIFLDHYYSLTVWRVIIQTNKFAVTLETKSYMLPRPMEPLINSIGMKIDVRGEEVVVQDLLQRVNHSFDYPPVFFAKPEKLVKAFGMPYEENLVRWQKYSNTHQQMIPPPPPPVSSPEKQVSKMSDWIKSDNSTIIMFRIMLLTTPVIGPLFVSWGYLTSFHDGTSGSLIFLIILLLMMGTTTLFFNLKIIRGHRMYREDFQYRRYKYPEEKQVNSAIKGTLSDLKLNYQLHENRSLMWGSGMRVNLYEVRSPDILIYYRRVYEEKSARYYLVAIGKVSDSNNETVQRIKNGLDEKLSRYVVTS